MRIGAAIGGVVGVWMLLSSDASACPMPNREVPITRPWGDHRPPTAPWGGGRPPVAPWGGGRTPAALRAEAAQKEARAEGHDSAARRFEQEAMELVRRARLLRAQASKVSELDRPSVLALAADLDARADEIRGEATRERATATALRAEAARLRRLADAGGVRPPPRPWRSASVDF